METFPDGQFTVQDREGGLHALPGVEGLSLMEILRAAGFDIRATCGGAAACGTCHVYVAGEGFHLPPVSPEEQWQLEHLTQVQPASRLACQILWHKAALDGLRVTLAPRE